MATETTLTAEQIEKIKKLQDTPEMVTRAFGYFTEVQVAGYKARANAWVIELTIWRILTIVLGAVALGTVFVPQLQPYALFGVLGWLGAQLAMAYVYFSLPKPSVQ